MPNEIYKLPITSSWMDSPKLYQRIGGYCELICEYENRENAEITQFNLIFGRCWAVKFTYYVANDAALIPLTYDKVVDFGETDWLEKIKRNLAASIGLTVELEHLGIYFDDGPLYEFICESFHAEEQIISSDLT